MRGLTFPSTACFLSWPGGAAPPRSPQAQRLSETLLPWELNPHFFCLRTQPVPLFPSPLPTTSSAVDFPDPLGLGMGGFSGHSRTGQRAADHPGPPHLSVGCREGEALRTFFLFVAERWFSFPRMAGPVVSVGTSQRPLLSAFCTDTGFPRLGNKVYLALVTSFFVQWFLLFRRI